MSDQIDQLQIGKMNVTFSMDYDKQIRFGVMSCHFAHVELFQR
jgi:hypothetical protein